MNYRFAVTEENYEDYSSGRVLYNQNGATSFPVRLASEIFQLCIHTIKQQGNNGPYTIYDPCCGGAYLLTTLTLKYGDSIKRIYASDYDENILSLAQKNLSLISIPGLNTRIEQINDMITLYKKESHLDALKSAERLKDTIIKRSTDIEVNCFKADITNLEENKDVIIEKEMKGKVDIVITDLPYGSIVSWHGTKPEGEAPVQMLNNILPLLADKSVVAVISNKKNPISHENYKRLEKINIGKRQILIFQPIKR